MGSTKFLSERVYQGDAIPNVVARKPLPVGRFGVRELVSLPTGKRTDSMNSIVRMTFGIEDIERLSEHHDGELQDGIPPELADFSEYATDRNNYQG